MVTSTELQKIRRYVAQTSVGHSTVRGYKAGTADACRDFLEVVDLKGLRGIKKGAFVSWLRTRTTTLQQQLPDQRRVNSYYGISRKVLNIFLHNCFYNRFLCSEYSLERLEGWLEVPIDSYVAAGLRKKANKHSIVIPNEIRRLESIKKLCCRTHGKYQRLAVMVADALKTQRVHLDAYFFRAANDD